MNEEAISHLKAKDKRLAKVIDAVGEIEIHQHSDSFYFIVREIVGQMVSAAVKKVIFDRLTAICNNNICPETLLKLQVEDLRAIGLSNAKSQFILSLAEMVAKGNINFATLETMSDEDVLNHLTSIKGIGNWTAKMYLLFFLQREDILPYEDGAFLQAYRWLYNTKKSDRKSIEKRCKKWKPYTSVGARYLYRALDTGLTKQPIKDFLAKESFDKEICTETDHGVGSTDHFSR